MTKTFRDLGVAPAIADRLESQGITHPFPIQELTLPLALDGHDLIGQARTGTGKTLAFGLPLLQRLDPDRSVTQALVVVPTRELCLQVYEDLTIGDALGLESIAVYGGVGYDEQIDALRGGAHVVVGTPGRLLDHLQRGNLDLSNVTELVLDEADEMLDMGFLPDVERLIEGCTDSNRHTMLFSATMPTAIVKLARRYLDHPTFMRAEHEERTTAPKVEQHFFQVHRMDKPRLLARILQTKHRGGAYVFVRTKHMADRLVNDLEELSIPAIAIHGDLRQTTRERNLDRFRDGKVDVLVATEVAARGLDVGGVTHVVNYDCPDDEKMYLHRIGRTARAGEAGVAITFAEFNETDRLNVIRKAVGATNREVMQVFSTSPVLAELFDLPETTPWARESRRDSDRSGSRGERGQRRDRETRRPSDRRASQTDGRPKRDRRAESSGSRREPDRERSARTDRATAEPQAESRAASSSRQTARAKADDAPRVRVRRRGRDTAKSEPTTAADTAAAADTKAESRDEDDASRRTRGANRTRARRPRARDTSAPATDKPADKTGDKGADEQGRDERGRDKADAAASRPRARRRRPSSNGGDHAEARRAPAGRGRANDRTNDRRTNERRGRQRPHADRAPAATREPVTGEANPRGDGQPRLARRVYVEHLP